MKTTTKRILALFLACLAGLGLASCALAPEEAETTAAKTTAAETTAAETTTPETTGEGGTTAPETTVPATEAPEPEPIVLKIVSLNAQNADYDRSGEATIADKYRKLGAAISAKTPDLVLLQECNTVESADGIRQKMTDASDYATVSGKNASTMVLYNTKVFDLISQGCEKIGSAGDENGSKYDRHMVWARLRHKESGAQIVVVPVHVDYVTTACKAQINIIVNYLKTNFPNIPFILGGDFNLEIGTISKTSLPTEGYLNARTSATEKVNGNSATFPEKGTVIDFIWYKSGFVYRAAARKYEVITDTLPTDHRPIYAELTLTRQ